MEQITLAGGCFWCIEAIFKRLKGVVKVTSGYAGGKTSDPIYSQVSSGTTGHAEAVQIEFDPKVISLEHILDVFWATHDSTTLNRQGNDVGTQYRSVIFYNSTEQQSVALKSKIQIEQTGSLPGNVVTTIDPLDRFYTAESYHHNYYEINKDSNPYCSLVIDPKIEKLIKQFNGDIKKEYLHE